MHNDDLKQCKTAVLLRSRGATRQGQLNGGGGESEVAGTCASRIPLESDSPSLREASCCIEAVLYGGFGPSCRCFEFTCQD